jgi:predicted nucleic acid-binding protein
MDGDNNPVEKFKERIAELVNTLNSEDTLIGVPTPVIAEILVHYPESKEEYLEVLRNRYKFDIIPFGIKAAIEASELIGIIAAETKQPAAQWAKVKFDIQITAMAKAENATMLYADDKGIVNNAKRIKVPAMRICDLPLPPERKPTPPPAVDDAGQTHLFRSEKVEDDKEQPKGEDQEIIAESREVRGSSDGSAGDSAGAEETKEKGEPEAPQS